MKICIGMPTSGSLSTKTVELLLTLVRHQKMVKDIQMVTGPYIHHNRNMIIEEAKKGEFTHLFFIDHDMYFNPSTLVTLLNHNKDIVGGLYNFKMIPILPMVFLPGQDLSAKYEDLPKELFKCDAMGMGCMLIKMSVFDKIEKPYYYYGDGNDMSKMGEDVYFCRKARETGFDVWCDPTMEIGHYGTYRY